MAKKKETAPENVTDLIAAMTHVCLAQQDNGHVYQAHCLIRNGTITAYNGIISAGATIRETFEAYPHSLKLLTALKRAREPVAITANANTLTMVSGPLRAVLQCVDPLTLTPVGPDHPPVPVDNAGLRASLDIIGPFASESAETMLGASIICINGSFCFCDGKLIIQHYHGQSMPECLIPKLFITAVDKIASPISHVGYSGRSITFYFENSNWLKTQLYDEKIPQWQQIIDVYTNPEPIVPNLFDVVATVAAFSPDGFIHLRPDYVYSHSDPNIGARHEIPFSTMDTTLNASRLIKISQYAKTIDFRSNPNIVYFFGDSIRGAIGKSVSR